MKKFLSSLAFTLLFLASSTHSHDLDAEYAKEFTDIVELVYGTEFLSQGGTDSVDMMFEEVDIAGKKILDVGSGLGGVDFYLAHTYNVDITGIDCVRRLVEDANARKAVHELQGSVTFLYQDPQDPSYAFADSSFDIIFSKEAFLHIPDKEAVLAELYRVLKPGGKLIILDWLVASHDLGPLITQMMEVDGLDLKMATYPEYRNALEKVGFQKIIATDMNARYVQYTGDNIATIQSKKALLIDLLGQETYSYALKTWNIQKKIFECNEVFVTLLKAERPIA